jgi:aspartate/methionine/tyrosine aminotransferase
MAMLGSEKIVHYPNPVGEGRTELLAFASQMGLIATGDSAAGDEAQVLPCVGATQGFTLFAKSHLKASDVVLFPRPSFTYFTMQVEDAGATAEFLDLSPANGYNVTESAIRSRIGELADVGSRVTVLYLAAPDNPTGAVLTEEEAISIAALAEELDLSILHDAAYYGTEYPPYRVGFVAKSVPERTVTLFSLSKAFGFAGLRSGFCVGPRESIVKMAEFLEDDVDSISHVAQEALRGCFSMDPKVRDLRESYFLRNASRHTLHGALTRTLVDGTDPSSLPADQSQWIRDRVLEAVGERRARELLGGVPGMSVLTSEEASFVLLADVSMMLERLQVISSSAELVDAFMELGNVRLMPGEGFHTPNTVRISFSPPPETIVAGFSAIHRALDSLK